MAARNRGRLLAVVLVIASIPIILLAGALLYPAIEQWRHAEQFSAPSWRAAENQLATDWPTRLRMVDDLTAHHKLIGLPRNALVALLGTPDDVEAFRERSRQSDDDTWDVGYELGPQRGSIVRIDNDWLLFDLDSSGKVQRFIVTHD